MSILSRILTGNAVLACAAILGAGSIGGVAYVSSQHKEQILESAFQSVAMAKELSNVIEHSDELLWSVLDMTRLTDLDKVQAEFLENSERLLKRTAEIHAQAETEAMIAALEQLEINEALWKNDANILLGIEQSSEIPTIERMQRRTELTEAGVEQVLVQSIADARIRIATANQKMMWQMEIAAAVTALLILLAFVNAVRVGRNISKPTVLVAQALRKMAGGAEVQTTKDEVAQMKQAAEQLEAEFWTFQENLNATVTAAAKGDLSVRMRTSSPQEDLRAISTGLNGLLEAIEEATTETSGVLKSFAGGQLSARIQGNYEGVFAELQRDANTTGEKLTELTEEIRDTIYHLNVALGPMKAGATDLQYRTEQQASALEMTTQNMQEMAETINSSADYATSADQLSREASTAANKGGEVASVAVSAIRKVSDGAQRIADITVLVEDIAFQTNLLALNAGVEAARAGESGRGFAVVASEVRLLAQKVADSSNEIKKLVDESIRDVREGVDSVEATGSALIQIEDQVAQASSKISEISAAAQQQSHSIREITQAISGLDEETSRNSDMARQSATELEKLGQQAERLSDLVGFFSNNAPLGKQRNVA
ncbi:hypothetical protein GFB49_13695 [Epibacterium sp. SM1979]|uniref:Methyl-accepting chemotaxis protein n=1 Tax=Tritonibacter litoralis TaxID=2662264 RepID=A0A843YLF9_9RHOB|nr:methyl-accepting chemotaxis protein [Tritonibacter litoralis]MQQ09517.1 hypothetical protein [Tritonibacter litoralis]